MAKILLVDDDEDFLTINRIILEKADYKVETANNPQAAWEKVQAWEPDLICLDVMMPAGTEGFHFAYKLRNHKKTRSIPVLMITSIHDHSDFQFSPDQDGEYLPVEDFVEKPIRADVLLEKVKELLGKAHEQSKVKDDSGIGLKKEKYKDLQDE